MIDLYTQLRYDSYAAIKLLRKAFNLQEKEMARPIATLLREGDLIKNSKMLTEAQKNHALTMLRKEIDEATGQSSLQLPEAGTGGVPPAPQSTPAAARRS